MTEISSETLILELARSLHACGSPAYELDQRMEQVATSLGRSATFFSTPTALFVTFDDDIDQGTRLMRVYPGDTNLRRYAELFELQAAIQDEDLQPPEAWQRLQQINSAADGYSKVVEVAAYAIVGACVAVLVGGNSVVIAASGAIGLIVGGLVVGLAALRLQLHLVNVIAGFVASTLACLVQVFIEASNFELTVLSSLIVLVPGLYLTISINELATQNLASGTARIAGAITTLLTMIFGVYMGRGIVAAFHAVPLSVAPSTPTLLASAIVIIPTGLCFAALFRTRYRDVPWLLLATVIAFSTMRLAAEFVSSFAAVWIASVVAGIVSHVITRRLRLPSAVMLMPALILLVPGSIGFSGMAQIMLQDDLPGGIRLVATMMLTSVAIVAGLLLTDALAPNQNLATQKPATQKPTSNA
ncbi:MAG: threonine/serine exporter family protein, partial [Rubripirellula sp.]